MTPYSQGLSAFHVSKNCGVLVASWGIVEPTRQETLKAQIKAMMVLRESKNLLSLCMAIKEADLPPTYTLFSR
jgi:hypothetical protein